MSYIIKCTDPFVSVKLTEKGREQLAKGLLNFKFWAAGDSEINYDREAIVEAGQLIPALSATSEIMRPRDRQPQLKSYLHSGGTEYFNEITAKELRTAKIIVNNKAIERGFFSGATTTGATTLTSTDYIVSKGTITSDNLTGGTTLNLGTGVSALTIGDTLLIKYTTPTLGTLSADTNSDATPQLFYKIHSSASTTEIIVDRALPNLSGATSVSMQYIVYPQGEVKDAFGYGSQQYYWDTQTLAFDSSCDVSIDDVPVWNMNNVYGENFAGLLSATSVYEGFERFGSYTYMGQMNPYFEFDLSGTGILALSASSACQALTGLDNGQKALSILHYTNNTISNFYGELFYIDHNNSKNLKLFMPDVMYHRRNLYGVTGDTGVTMGMEFISTGDTMYVGTSDIEYYDLIESPTYLTGRTPLVVGRVFPQLKMVTIHDEELIAAMSYKSNRNWTLPALGINLQSPSSGVGLLNQNKVIYVTYQLVNTGTTGYTTSLPCQKYSKIKNTTNSAKDVDFKIEGINLLPYMRKTEDASYDGRGFQANAFRVLYQIVDTEDTRPNPAAWSAVNFTTTAITDTVGATISPVKLANQNPAANGFILTSAITATTFSIIGDLSMPLQSTPDLLQFGDERFFYGNLSTHIGATIFKTIFDVRLNSGFFKATTNSTRSTDMSTNPPKLRVSEIGIYDTDKNLVMIGKISQPLAIVPGETIMLELSIDF